MSARPARSALRRPRVATATAVLLLAVCGPGAAQVEEHALKAAFVYNIIVFAGWEHAPQAGPLTVCTAVDPAFSAALDALEGKQVGDRRIALKPAAGPGAACDVQVRSAGVPAEPARAGRLEVCDGCALPDSATAVALVRDGARVRFEIDATAAGRAGITFSSRLLHLARRVL